MALNDKDLASDIPILITTGASSLRHMQAHYSPLLAAQFQPQFSQYFNSNSSFSAAVPLALLYLIYQLYHFIDNKQKETARPQEGCHRNNTRRTQLLPPLQKPADYKTITKQDTQYSVTPAPTKAHSLTSSNR